MKRNRQWLRSVLILSAGAAGCGAEGPDVAEDELGTATSALCSAVSTVSNDADNSAVSGATVLWTATPTCTGTAEYSFHIRSPSGVWTLGRDWSTTNTFSWNTTGLAVGFWSVKVWVRDVPGGKYQVTKAQDFELTSSAACTSQSSTTTPNPVVKGNTVTFTNSAGGCPSPEFQILHLPPGGSYQVDSAYSPANSTYQWNTTSAVAGTHNFQVRARSQGSTAAYHAYSTFPVKVTASAPCTGATLALSPATHSPVGTQVTLSATATGCASPTFQYVFSPPGGPWQILQSYTTSNTVTWNTTLAPAGAYSVQVWARESGATTQYDFKYGRPYTLDAVTPTSPGTIGGGYAHNCVLLASGKVGCWGYSNYGQVGNGTIATKVTTPVAVTGLTNGISLASGFSHSCAVRLGGTVSCWGSNFHGQLGNGTNTDSSTPVTVSGISSATSIAAGNSHNCVALVDGSVRCWGYNSRGQLGTGSAGGDSYVPVTVPGLSNVASLSAGYYHSCALLRDGTVRCWGTGAAGQLGNGGTTSLTPVAVTGLTNVVSIITNNASTCAVKSDGTIWCWGGNSPYGILGNGSTAPATTPVQVTGITNAKSVALGLHHACAALTSGSVSCWGYNFHGQLGNATNTDSLVTVPVSGISTATSVGGAQYTSCAALADGTSRCWGYGSVGSLGNGGQVNSNIPVAVAAVP